MRHAPPDLRHAGVVHQDVDGPKLALRLVQQALHIGRLGQVGDDSKLVVFVAGQFVEPIQDALGGRGDRDPRAGVGQLTRVGPGTPMGEAMRRYWMPALLANQLAKPDGPPVRVRLLGEDLVAFRDTQARVGLVEEYCPHRRASLFLGRNEENGLRCVYHGWKFNVRGSLRRYAERAGGTQFQRKSLAEIVSHPRSGAG